MSYIRSAKRPFQKDLFWAENTKSMEQLTMSIRGCTGEVFHFSRAKVT